MTQITLKGNPIETSGQLPPTGDSVPDLTLISTDLAEVSLSDYSGKRKVLNIFVSLDTGVCATSVKKFNEAAASLDNTVVLNISKDLPFALGRFCGAEGISNSVALSAFRSSFATDYGLEISSGPLTGLCSRAVIILNEDNQVLHSEQVPEITQEPDYEAALSVLKA